MSEKVHSFLIKNRIIDNASNKINKLRFNNYDGESIIKINTGGYLNNGYLFVDVNSTNKIDIYYKNVLIFTSSSSDKTLIPCVFETDSFIRINGKCDHIKILIYGAEFVNIPKDYLVPMCNKIAVYSGDGYNVCSYQSNSDLKSNQFTLDFKINKLIDLQMCTLDEDYLGYLYEDSGLCLSLSKDNYANKIIIINNYIDAKIVPDKENNRVYIFYIADNKLYYKIINSDLSISEEILVDINFDDVVRSLEYISIINFGKPILIINLNNSRSMFLLISDDKFKCVLIKKSVNIDVFLNNNIIDVCVYDSNKIELSKYLIDDQTMRFVPLNMTKQMCNIDRVIRIDDGYLLFNDDFCTEVRDVDIFDN